MNNYSVIFDMDGVISATQKLQSKAESETLALYGLEFSPEEICAKYSGIYDKAWFRQLFKENNITSDSDKAISEKWALLKRRIKTDGISAIEGVQALIEKLSDKNIPMGVGSASPAHFIEFTLNHLNLTNFFSSIHSAEDVKFGKPEPDLFLLVAKELMTPPSRCIVIEDGRSGMIAAHRAGMKCIGLVDNTNGDYPADLLVNSLIDITPETIQSLLES